MSKNLNFNRGEKYELLYVLIKNAIFFLGPLGLPSYRRNPQPPQREHLAIQNKKFLHFLFFCGPFLLFLNPDPQTQLNPDPQTQFNPGPNQKHRFFSTTDGLACKIQNVHISVVNVPNS
jgi:hypothetical protein